MVVITPRPWLKHLCERASLAPHVPFPPTLGTQIQVGSPVVGLEPRPPNGQGGPGQFEPVPALGGYMPVMPVRCQWSQCCPQQKRKNHACCRVMMYPVPSCLSALRLLCVERSTPATRFVSHKIRSQWSIGKVWLRLSIIKHLRISYFLSSLNSKEALGTVWFLPIVTFLGHNIHQTESSPLVVASLSTPYQVPSTRAPSHNPNIENKAYKT